MTAPTPDTRTYPQVWGGTVVATACGCRCVAASETPARIFYCPLHAAAPALREALETALQTIRVWHGIGLPPEIVQETWTLYQQSPEMQEINAALAQAKGEQR